jgi:ABC-2 type transport system permease protein
MMLVLTAVFSALFKNNIPNFPVYLTCGKLIFDFNSEATKSALNSIISNASLIKKVYVPKYVFPIADALTAFVNLLFSLIALVIVIIFTKAPLTQTVLLFWVPIVYVFIFSTGLGLVLASINVFFRDVKHLYGVFILMWMYLTPLFYPAEILPPPVFAFIRYNPMHQFVYMFRGFVMYNRMPTLSQNLFCVGVSVSMFVIGLVVFKLKQDKFIMYI